MKKNKDRNEGKLERVVSGEEEKKITSVEKKYTQGRSSLATPINRKKFRLRFFYR